MTLAKTSVAGPMCLATDTCGSPPAGRLVPLAGNARVDKAGQGMSLAARDERIGRIIQDPATPAGH